MKWSARSLPMTGAQRVGEGAEGEREPGAPARRKLAAIHHGRARADDKKGEVTEPLLGANPRRATPAAQKA